MKNEQTLLQAAAQGDLKKMQDAVAQGASVDAKEADGLTALIISGGGALIGITFDACSNAIETNGRVKPEAETYVAMLDEIQKQQG